MSFKDTFKLLAINLGLAGTAICRLLSRLFRRISENESRLIEAGDKLLVRD